MMEERATSQRTSRRGSPGSSLGLLLRAAVFIFFLRIPPYFRSACSLHLFLCVRLFRVRRTVLSSSRLLLRTGND
jgi:hypothetical protein